MGQVNCIFLKDKLKSADTASQKSTASPCKRPVSLPLVTENRVALSACGLLRLCACVLWPPNQLLSIALLSCSAYVVQCLRRVVLTSCSAYVVSGSLRRRGPQRARLPALHCLPQWVSDAPKRLSLCSWSVFTDPRSVLPAGPRSVNAMLLTCQGTRNTQRELCSAPLKPVQNRLSDPDSPVSSLRVFSRPSTDISTRISGVEGIHS